MNTNNWTKLAKQIGVALLLLMLGVLVVAAANKRSHRDATEVDIQIRPLESGQYLLDEEDVAMIVERAFGHRILGQEIGSLDVARVERVLEADPFVLDAEVYADAENEVHIEIDQREPLLRIIDENGLSYYLDEKGVQMPLSAHATARVLVATGAIPPHVPDYLERDRHVIKSLFELVSYIEEDPLLNAMITQVYVDKSRAYTLVPNIGKQKIQFGQMDRMIEKFDKLKIFYQEGMSRAGWHRYTTINLEYEDQVVCKKG